MIVLNANRRLVSSVIIGMFLISVAGLGACARPAPTPTPTMPTPADIWAADGTITVREYAGNRQYDDYNIFWWNDEQHVYIGMRAKTGGFVAVGIQPGERMKNADMVFGFVKNGQTTVYDLFSTGDFGPHSLDTELGGTDDILDSGGKEENGYTTIEFKRLLNTSDRHDHPLARGANKIIWAYGPIDNLTQKHSYRGYGEINLR